MKAVIDGRLYNTATAEKIAEYASGGNGDFRAVSEALYRTQKGNWFLAGAGGPMTRWAESTGQNSYSGGSGIQIIDEDEALLWCERHDIDADTIAAHFALEEA